MGAVMRGLKTGRAAARGLRDRLRRHARTRKRAVEANGVPDFADHTRCWPQRPPNSIKC